MDSDVNVSPRTSTTTESEHVRPGHGKMKLVYYDSRDLIYAMPDWKYNVFEGSRFNIRIGFKPFLACFQLLQRTWEGVIQPVAFL